VDAAQSGLTGHGQESWCQTTVTGPGSLSFWWKVSSETGFDYLDFYIDGVLQAGHISGNVDWQQQTYPLGAGAHTLRWRYAKDASVTSGSDTGWVDQLEWTPGGATPYAIWVAAKFTPLEAANPLISGPDADPDRDGRKNLIEFAFGLEPKSGPSLQLPQPQRIGGSLVTSFTEPAGVGGIIYGAEWSTTLAPGSWTAIPDTGIAPQHTFSVPIGSHPKLLVRLIVTMP
jgi:hypothetical protein